ncbi:MAG: hypothetical protein ACI88H_001883 [Cocleimonas sp.]|jgi:hypothetical protein
MKFSTKLLSAAVLMASSSIALAATDSAVIDINVTKDAYVNLIGSLSGISASPLTEAEVNGVTTVLGTLGTESNTIGGCDIDITSLNDYKLQHDVNLTLFLHGAASYIVNYGLSTFSSGSAATLSQDTCNESASNLSITSPAIPAGVVLAGTYSDTLTVTVTTQ